MFSKEVTKNTKNASMIRKMFEIGKQRADVVGADNVFDFSIGNPYLEPPNEVFMAIEKHYKDPGVHKYMPNAGFPDVLEKVALYHSRKNKLQISSKNIVMTSGAAGGLNIVLKAILNPEDEVIIIAPYFVEYLFYVENFQGNPVIVKTLENFQLDIEAIISAITPKTKAIILNSPNNPTGVIYDEADLIALNSQLLNNSAPIFVVLDEPYAAICYDGINNPNTLKIFDNAIYCNSFSKTLGLAGERIGYVIASSKIKGVDQLMENLIFANRTLGFGNANALFQKVVGDCLDAKVDVDEYTKNRDLLTEYLKRVGYHVAIPMGAFYLFVKIPKGYDCDVVFSDAASRENVLVVPGSGFGYPGYVRISYCVSHEKIRRAINSKAFEKLNKENSNVKNK